MTQSAVGLGLGLLVREERVEAAEWRNFIQDRSAEARISLFDRYVPLARAIARSEWNRMVSPGFELCDAEQLAHEALLAAIERYDPARCVPFASYARARLVGTIRNERKRTSEAAAVAGHKARAERDRVRSLKRASSASSTDIVAQLRELAAGIALGILLDTEATSEVNQVADSKPSPYDDAAWHQMLSDLKSRLARLPERERLVIDYHYAQGVQFKEIADLLGLSKGRVSQIHAMALQRLRQALQRYK
jgi:RNA polymerase sigma factor for flagellar operon FliA